MKKYFTCIFALLFSVMIYAQSSEVITEILESKEATFGQVCYFIATQQDLIDENDSFTQAIQVLYNEGQIPHIIHSDTPIPLVDVAFLFAQAWNVKGGLMYKLFNGAPRYAFKQLKSDGIIPKNKYPRTIVSGRQILDMFTSASLVYGNMKLIIDNPEYQNSN